MTLAEIFSSELPEEQAAAKAAVLRWLGSGDDNRRRFEMEEHRDAADADRAAVAAGEREGQTARP